MTELETMQRAKMYLDKLVQGIDPITDHPVADNDSLRNPRLARCFQYVSGVLEKVIANGGQVISAEKPSFTITDEQIAKVQLSGEPLRIADFVDRILQTTGYEGMKKPYQTHQLAPEKGLPHPSNRPGWKDSPCSHSCRHGIGAQCANASI